MFDESRYEFIQLEIEMGFTFLQTAQLTDNPEHYKKAVANSQRAHDTANRYINNLATTVPELHARLRELGSAIRPFAKANSNR